MRFHRRVSVLATLGCLLLLALALGGCGRRGGLEPPPDPSVAAAPATDATLQPLEQRTKRVPITPPHQPFILDPLL